MKLKKRVLSLGVFLTIFINFFILQYNWNNNPVSLSGPPYVEGWYPNTSRVVTDYISEYSRPLIKPKNFCVKNYDLLIMVHSKPDNFEARQKIRESWGQKGEDFSLCFLIGEDSNHDSNLQSNLNSESVKYNDIIQERFIDSYNNLTLKTVNMLKLFHLHCSHNYLLKIDDDVFFFIDNLLTTLRSLNRTNLLLGKLMSDTKPIRDPESKWYVPFQLYPEDTYPDYLCGAAYLISKDVVERLYNCTLQTPIFHIEDVYVTGICSEKIDVKPMNDFKFTCHISSRYVCLNRDLYTIHRYTPEEIKASYDVLKSGGCPAKGSLREWFNSLFWSGD